MPAVRLTANCIRLTLESTGKRHLILTGRKQSGKTTLFHSLFPQGIPGITGWVIPKQAVYIGQTGTDDAVMVGCYRDDLPGESNRMQLYGNGFETYGIPLLQKLIDSVSEWIGIDEIGYLETAVPAYCEAIESLMDKKRLAAVVRKQDFPFLKKLCQRDDVLCVDLDDPFGEIGCVVMASGLGKRFGGNKLMADFHGKPLIHRVLDATDGIFTKRVVVTRHSDVATYCRQRDVSVVCHDLPDRSDTVRLGLGAVGEVQNCLFCPGDQPLLQWDTVAAIALATKTAPEWIWRTAFEQTPGSPVSFPKWSYPQLRALCGNQGGGYVIKQYPDRVGYIMLLNVDELKDVDTKEEWMQLSEL